MRALSLILDFIEFGRFWSLQFITTRSVIFDPFVIARMQSSTYLRLHLREQPANPSLYIFLPLLTHSQIRKARVKRMWDARIHIEPRFHPALTQEPFVEQTLIPDGVEAGNLNVQRRQVFVREKQRGYLRIGCVGLQAVKKELQARPAHNGGIFVLL